MSYRRTHSPGASYFFTVVTHQRQPLFQASENIQLLRTAFHHVKQKHPFALDAIVVLPDHLHALWTLPAGDANFSTRWRLIKEYVTRRVAPIYRQTRSRSRLSKQEQAVWQRRFWEHQIQDERDFEQHFNYIHINPVKHGYVANPADWPYSSFRKYVQAGVYAADWGRQTKILFASNIGHE
jgi:putative transposase